MARSVFVSAMGLVAVTFVGRLFGFLRNVYLAKVFGTGSEADAYFVALTLPLTLSLVVPGMLNALWVPTAKGLMERGATDRLHRVAAQSCGVVAVAFGVLSLAVWVGAEVYVALVAPGFTGETRELTVSLVRWMAPSLLLIGLSAWYSSLLNSHNRFFLPALGGVVNSLMVLLALWIWAPRYGIVGVTWGTLLGFGFSAALLLPAVWRRGYRAVRVPSRPLPSELVRMGERFIPLAFGALLTQLTQFLERAFSSQLGTAKVAALSYAQSIAQLPMGLFVGTFTLPLFPLLSEYVKKGAHASVAEVYSRGLQYLFVLLVPTTAFLWVLGPETVRLFYGRGAFDAQATALTAVALAGYSVGLLFLAVRDLVTRAFYAYEDAKTPVYIGAASVAAYAAFAWGLSRLWGHAGVALASSLSAVVGALALAVLLAVRRGIRPSKALWRTAMRTAVASAAMAATVFGFKHLPLPQPWPLCYVLWTVVAVGTYLAVLGALREPLLRDLAARLPFGRRTASHQ